MTKFKFLSLIAFALLQLWSVKASAIVSTHWTGTAVENIGTNEKVMLFNLGTGNWLGRGNIWGVEATQSDMPMPMTIEHSTNETTNQEEYRFRTTFQQRETTGQDQKSAYMSLSDHSKTAGDWYTYLLDRSYDQGTAIDDADRELCNFTLEKVDNADGKQVYRIKRYSNETGEHQEWGKTRGFFTPGLYVMAAQYNPKSSDVDLNTHDNCINAFLEDENGSTGITDGSDEWLLVTEDEVKRYYAQLAASYGNPATSTFLIKDYDFARNDNEVTNYKRADGTDLQLGDNLATDNYTSDIKTNFAHNPGEATGKYTYYVGNGLARDAGWGDADHGQEGSGNAWTANIHGNSGKIYQNVDGLFRDGWYEIRVNAFTTKPGSAKLYASVDNATTNTSVLTNYQEATISTATETPKTYVAANDLVNTYEKDADGNEVKDADGNNIYQYQAFVRVYVSPTGGTTTGGTSGETALQSLQFGVKVDNGDADSWTCLDNFQLYYLGPASKVVVLDENRTSVDYMNTQNTQMARERSAVVYLHRELNPNTWNSLVLPFDMDASTVKSTFGANTILSEFYGAIDKNFPGRMFFKETDKIQKDHLYIILPEVAPAALPERATAKDDGTDEAKFENIYLEKGTKAYVITGVLFGRDVSNGEAFKADGKIEGHIGPDTYGGSDNVQFVGTYISDEYSQSKTGSKQVPVNSYVIAGNTSQNHVQGLWYLRDKSETASKGFRGWLQVSTPNPSAKISFVINGVLDDTATAIDGIHYGYDVRRLDSDVYNLNGQLVRKGNNLEGLPAGLYIVSGKKYMVR